MMGKGEKDMWSGTVGSGGGKDTVWIQSRSIDRVGTKVDLRWGRFRS